MRVLSSYFLLKFLGYYLLPLYALDFDNRFENQFKTFETKRKEKILNLCIFISSL